VDPLNTICEDILLYIINNVDEHLYINPEDIQESFSQKYQPRIVENALKELEEHSCIMLSIDYTGEIFNVRLTNTGEFYFINYRENAQAQQPTYNIVNSPCAVIGNNNSVSVNNGVDFSEAYTLVEKMDESNKAVFFELVSIMQDCLEKSKPIPKSKLAKAIEITSDIIPIASAIGNAIIKYFIQ